MKKLAPEVCKIYFIPDEDLMKSFIEDKELNKLGKPFVEIGKSFKFNINCLFSTISIPYEMAFSGTIERHFQRIHSAERIRSLNIPQKRGENQNSYKARCFQHAREKAEKRLVEFMESNEGRDILIKDTCIFLLHSKKNNDFEVAVSELLLQGIILCWGAFEVLSHDCFVAILNKYPTAVELLAKDPVAKRRFELSRIPLELLSLNKYDVSDKMGTILAGQHDISDITSIKAIYEALFQSNVKLKSLLNHKDMRLLSVRRNLVAHRRGVIDDTYIKQTECSQKLGERLIIKPFDIYKHIESIIKVGSALVEASSKFRC